MNYDEIYIQLNKQRNLASTFPAIREKARMLANWTIAEEVERLWATYRQMLQFAMRGVKDPHAAVMRDDIVGKLSRLVLNMERQERLNEHKEQRYVNKRRELQNIPSMESIVNMLVQTATDIARVSGDDLIRESVKDYNLERLEADHEMSLVRLFNWLWTSEQWSANDANIISNLLFSNQIKDDDKAVIVSAITLSILEYADKAKLLLLLDCYLSDSVQVSQRALVGFVLAMMAHYHLHYEGVAELSDRLEAFKDDTDFINDIFMVMTLLQSSSVTDKVTSKMRQDIMPALIQAQFKKHNNKNSDAELNKNGENPEWMDDKNLDKKMHEMVDLQLSGADVYYSSFAHMKGHSFFSEMAHWFYPFAIDSPNVPEIKRLLSSKIGNIVRLMLKSSPFCNSDKYSICFTFNSIGAFGEQMVEKQIYMQLPEDESLDDLISEAEKRTQSKRDVCRSYIFDLYRFYYSYPFHIQFTNLFETLKKNPITIDSNSAFELLLGGHADEIAQYADFLMRKEFYSTAKVLFEKLLHDNEFDPSLAVMWQKLGFCYQKATPSDGQKALHAYEVANNLKPDSKWTLTHLVSVCDELSLNDDMIRHCNSLLEVEPDNVKYILKCANALAMKKKDYEAALPLLHKANYIDEQSEIVKTLLALCLLMTGENDKAMRHIMDLMPSETHGEDAKVLYSTAMLIQGNTEEAFTTLANIDKHTLTSELLTHCLQAVSERNLLEEATVQLLRDAIDLKDEK